MRDGHPTARGCGSHPRAWIDRPSGWSGGPQSIRIVVTTHSVASRPAHSSALDTPRRSGHDPPPGSARPEIAGLATTVLVQAL
jgi:hypothetical protein